MSKTPLNVTRTEVTFSRPTVEKVGKINFYITETENLA
jgi:hypothetical protein